MPRWLPVPVALALIAAAGVAHGLWVDRWYPSDALRNATARVAAVPLTIGDWVGRDNQDAEARELTADLIRRGALTAMIARTYRNRRTGETVTLTVAAGRPGPIATHNPTTCIPGGSQFTQESAAAAVAVAPPGGRPATFSRGTFRGGRLGPHEEMTVLWSWLGRGGWVATDDPRLTFASYKALTKIYVAQAELDPALRRGGRAEVGQVAEHFLRDCLPAIDAALAPPAAAPPRPAPAPAA